MEPPEIERDLAFAIRAARGAGERAFALRGLRRWQDTTLGDVADQACDAWLNGLIEGRYPDDGVLTEESTDAPARLAKRRCWIIDPVDGTREYRENRPDWAVHVGLVLDGAPALGAVALPVEGLVAWGVCLHGKERAGVSGEAGDGPPPAPGDSAPPDAPRLILSRSRKPEWIERFAEQLGAAEIQRAGSVGFKVARLLLGEADVYVTRNSLHEWDACAPEAIARAAGWTVCRLAGDAQRYNQPDPHGCEMLVCRPSRRDHVLAALRAAGALET